jgi:hypothetical protein
VVGSKMLKPVGSRSGGCAYGVYVRFRVSRAARSGVGRRVRV